MEFVIKEISDDDNLISDVKTFLYDQIKKVYGIGPNMKFHYDIERIGEYYIYPQHNTFFIAYLDDKIVATAGVRGYDKDYDFFKGKYSKDNTASIWRLMVDEDFQRRGIARKLVEAIEDFCRGEGYLRIYLHTHRYLESALSFWGALGYEITLEEDDYDETTHMVKNLN